MFFARQENRRYYADASPHDSRLSDAVPYALAAFPAAFAQRTPRCHRRLFKQCFARRRAAFSAINIAAVFCAR